MASLKVLSAGSLALAAVLALSGSVGASTPPNHTVTVPATVGSSVTVEWTGTILPGANATSSCASLPTLLSDQHGIAIAVPPGTYDRVKAVFTFSITWADSLHDEILTVTDPGSAVIGSSDGGSNVETVVAANLEPGTYTTLACAFAAAVPVSYRGTLTIEAREFDAPVPSAPADGLEFTASVAADNQRDESEPLVEIDPAGNIFSCGPSGSSQAADYAQVSTDGGDSFHLLGTPPRGQAAAGGGGDCAVAFGHRPNSRGHYDWSYTGLGPLTGFATGVSPNAARSIATAGFDFTGGVTNQGGVADRQWQTFVSDTDVLLIYNQVVPRNTVVLRSTDKGLTYNPATAVVGATAPLFPGPIRNDEPRNVTYFAWDDTGTSNGKPVDFISLSVSFDDGRTWRMCVVDAVEGENPGFVSSDHDRDGNIYVGYADGSDFHTYVRVIRAADVAAKCVLPASTTAQAAATSPAAGGGVGTFFGPRVQVDRDAVKTTVFPWLTAGAAPGHVAFMFAGTETDGDPNLGTFEAAWDVYVSTSSNLLDAGATFRQVKATTHPFHYDSICLQGLGCDLAVPPGDRTMADFLAIDYNPVTKKLTVVFNRTNKLPGEPLGHVASPMAVTQSGGPTLDGGMLANTRPTLRTESADPAGDALSLYSVATPAVVPPDPPSVNEPAADFRSVSVGPEILLSDGSAVQDGGFTVTMQVADLRPESLLDTMTRTQSQSLLWVFRFTNGHQDVAASARWNPVHGFTFGYNEYTTGPTPCLPATSDGDKCIRYPGDWPIQGKVDQESGTIQLSVPRWLLRGLEGPTGHRERPTEVPATVGTRFYDATAWSLGNTLSPVQDVQSFLYPLDSTPALDFLLPAGGGQPGGECSTSGGGSIGGNGSGDGKFSLDANATPAGSVAYRDKAAGIDFQSTSIESVTCDGRTATVRGTGRNGDDTGVPFTVETVDNGEPGTGDRFAITLDSPASYNRSGTLTRGNIKVRP
jgi:hypothetical protein